MKLREDNVFSRVYVCVYLSVCLSVHMEVPVQGPGLVPTGPWLRIPLYRTPSPLYGVTALHPWTCSKLFNLDLTAHGDPPKHVQTCLTWTSLHSDALDMVFLLVSTYIVCERLSVMQTTFLYTFLKQ